MMDFGKAMLVKWSASGSGRGRGDREDEHVWRRGMFRSYYRLTTSDIVLAGDATRGLVTL
jgi:hypothetical protein